MLKEMGFYRGVNLGGWLSQCDYSEEHLARFITETDFAQIASWGFDHVRIPIDYNVVQNEDGTLKEAGLQIVDAALALCGRCGLNAVLDLHKTQGFSFDADEHEEGFFDSTACQERFYAIWECFAARYGQLHERVAFELLNEVTEECYLAPWMKIARECVRRIRLSAPLTPILFGSYRWNSAQTVPALESPFDSRVFYSFHFYEPHTFTHQGAWWEAPYRDVSARCTYVESGASQSFFEEFIAPALEKAAREGTELYCGEYGVIDVVPPEEALKWFRDLHVVFERHGIAHSLWTYKEKDFGLSDARLDGVRNELLTLL